MKDYQEDLASIRNLMERSLKFISLSGLSGILAGIYALAGAAVAFFILQYPDSPAGYLTRDVNESSVIMQLLAAGAVVLVGSVGTGLWLSMKMARKRGDSFWNETSRRLVINLAIPLLTGGLFILALLWNEYYGVAVPACLVFYGLALINASPNLYEEIRYLGYSEIGLGLVCACLPDQGLLFWAIGFGVFHILYGALMFRKYDG